MNKNPSRFSLYALSCLVFLISDPQGGVGPFIAIYFKTMLNWDAGRIGMVLAVYNIASLLFQIPGGLLIDSIKFKRLLIAVATTISAMGCLIIVNSNTLYPIVFAQILIGVATSILPPAVVAITLGLVGRESFPRRLAINGTFTHTGNVFNTFLTGLMVYWFGITLILYVDVFFSLASILPLFLIRNDEINNEVAREASQVNNQYLQPLPIKKLLTTPTVILFGIALILFVFSNAAQLPLVGQKIANIVPRWAVTYMASSIIIAQLVMIGVAYALSFFIEKIGRKPLFIASFLVLIIRATLSSLTKNPHLLLGNQVLDGLGAGIFSIVSVVIIADIAKDSGRFNFMQGLMIFCISIGAALSYVISGYIAKSFGIDLALLMLALVAVVGVVFYSLFMPETKIS